MNTPVLVIAAGCGVRLGSSSNKLNIKFVDEERLWEKQCKALFKIYSDINYVTGFRADTVDTQLERNDVLVHNNQNFENSNVAFSIKTGLKEIRQDKGCLVILGDLYFNTEFLENLPKPSGHSFLIVDSCGNFDKKEIGINKENAYLDYNFAQKWAQVCYLSPQGIQEFIYYSSIKSNIKKYCFEIINDMTHFGHKFQILEASGCVVEIDRQKDINKVNCLIQNQQI